MPATQNNDGGLIALIAEHDQLHRNAPPEGLSKADDESAGALWGQITATIPRTPEGVLALLEYSDCDENDLLATAAITGLRAIVAKAAEPKVDDEPPFLPLPPGTIPLQAMIEVEHRVETLSIKITGAADNFKFWLREQEPNVQELTATVVDVSKVEGLADRIREQAYAVLDKIHATVPTTVADAIALLESGGDPPLDAVIAGLRAIAEKGGVA